MDIQKEKRNYLAMLVAEEAITLSQSNSLGLYHGGNYFHSESISSSRIDCINWGWQGWLKAKAQAVPEGFVLVPKYKTESFSKKLDDYLDDLWRSGHGFDDGFLDVKQVDHDKIWTLVLEAQEQGHD